MPKSRKHVDPFPQYVILMASVWASATMGILLAESARWILWTMFIGSVVAAVWALITVSRQSRELEE